MPAIFCPSRARRATRARRPANAGKRGSKIHVLSDARGRLLVVAVTAANTHNSLAVRPLVRGLPAIRSRRGPRRRRPRTLRADNGYDYDTPRCWLRDRGITPRIARHGVDSSDRLGRHHWKIERTIAWLFRRRLTVRYERHANLFTAFLTVAATLTCYNKLTT